MHLKYNCQEQHSEAMVYLLLKKYNSKSLVLEILVKRTKKFTFKFKALTLTVYLWMNLLNKELSQ